MLFRERQVTEMDVDVLELINTVASHKEYLRPLYSGELQVQQWTVLGKAFTIQCKAEFVNKHAFFYKEIILHPL